MEHSNQNKKQKFSLLPKHKKLIKNTTGILLVALVLLLSFTETPTDWLRGQFQISDQSQPKILVWKLTHLPSSAPAGTLPQNNQTISNSDHADYQGILNLAIEASTNDVTLSQLAVEIDLDDNPEEISIEEGKVRGSIEYVALFTEAGEKLGVAQFTQFENQIIAVIKDFSYQIKAKDIASLSLRIKPVPELKPNTKIRLQFFPEQTIATSSEGSPATIDASLGENNNSNPTDDLISSEVLTVQ